jgi:hypothetical protein
MRRNTSMLRRLRSGLGLLWRSEAGIALPMALTVTTLGLGLGSVAAVSAINAQSGGLRDQQTKSALAAADAGAERALYRYNKVATTTATPCLSATGTLVALSADAWCPAISGTVGSASYSYRVRPIVVSGEIDAIDIVSTGTVGDVTRRILVQGGTPTGNVFSDFDVLSNTDITLDANSGINTGTATNGSVHMASNSIICGNIQYGVGHNVTLAGNAHQCPGYTNGPGTIDLPLVNQGDVATNNSNGRFFTQDLRSSATRVTYTPSTRTLQLNANSSLTLGAGTAGGGPGNYSLCKLVMASNTTLYIAAGANVRIYFDSPENCHQPDNTLQMDMSSNSNVLTTGGSPATATFLFVGSQTLRTRAILSSNTTVGCNFEVLLYGPLTDLTLNSNTSICGGVAAHSIHLNSFAHISPHADADDFSLPLPTHFTSARYVECSASSPTGAPNSGC